MAGDATAPSEWAGFHKAALARPARELLRRTLGCFQVEQRPPGVAVDVGCGSGPDSFEMLQRGWTVHALDADAAALQMLEQAVPAEWRARLHLHAQRLEDFDFPACDLIWSSWTLPFCPREAWPAFWQRALAALNPGGRIAGDLFGDQHAFASEPDVMLVSEGEARAALQSLQLEAFDIENGYRPSGGQITRWHAFGFAARKADTAAQETA